jgi:hypothetical protein
MSVTTQMRDYFAAMVLLTLTFASPLRAQQDKKQAPEAVKTWVEPMKRVHAQFKGQPGTFATFGDSITVSMAFWAPLRNTRKNMSPQAEAAFKRVDAYMKPECWSKWRGPDFGNEGGMTIVWAEKNVRQWLHKHNPETALIMFGTNDLNSVPMDVYARRMRQTVDACLGNGTIVILSTIPPRSGLLERSRQFADIARKVAMETKVPLCDYFAECLKRRPSDWDGAAETFKDYKGYDVPTLIARDGVHPSFPKKYQGDYSDEGLKSSGYGLRSYVTLLAYDEVIREVLRPAKGEGK